MGRTPCCTKIGLQKGPWTAKEDEMLKNYIQSHGEGHWRSLPEKTGLLRCGKSCRLRWMNYLRPDIKRGDISPDEDDLIIRMHALLGNRWSLIAGRLPRRTDNEIKNYWNTHLSKKLKTNDITINTNINNSNNNEHGFKKNNVGGLVFKPKPIRVTSPLMSSTHLCMFNKDICNDDYNINGICNINNIGMSGTDHQNYNKICSDNYYANIGIEYIRFVDCLASEKNEHQETAAASNERTRSGEGLRGVFTAVEHMRWN